MKYLYFLKELLRNFSISHTSIFKCGESFSAVPGTRLVKVRFQVLTVTSMKMTLLGSCTVENGRNRLIFQRCELSPSSGHHPETSVNFYQTTRWNIPEDSQLEVCESNHSFVLNGEGRGGE
jgi:hypothetical protein